jgi:predicted Zn-ribbon and HTH transcriptional regulator
MRKLSVGALMGALSLIVVAVAIGASATSGTNVQQFDQTYSAKKPSKNTGTSFATSSTDPANARNKQPKRTTNFDITFPKGSKIDSKAVPQCAATEADFAAQTNPDKACPKGSKVGTGTVAARLPYQGTADLNGTVSAYNANKGLLLYVVVQSPLGNQVLLIKPKFKGLKLLTTVPPTCIPPQRPDQGCKDANGEEQSAILTSFTLKTKPVGTKGKKLITTPATCPAAGWKFVANIKYADGTAVTIPSTQKCSK